MAGPAARPYLRLDPPAAELWIKSIEAREKWLWPIKVDASRGRVGLKLVHNPRQRHQVAGVEHVAGAVLSAQRIRAYAPPE